MFAGLFFLIIVLLLVTLSPESSALYYENEPWQALAVSVAIYSLLLTLIYAAARQFVGWIRRHKPLAYGIVNVVLISYLLVYHYVFASHRIIPFSFANAVTSLFLYFLGLAVYHVGAYQKQFLYPGAERETRWSYASKQLRMWIPFALPFLLFTFLFDVLLILPENQWTSLLLYPENTPASLFIFFSFTASVLVLIMIFLPYFIQKMWLCEKIEDTELWLRLTKTCQKANFRCAGLRIWTVMNNFHTAAIIGIIPRFRYVMFTKRLLYEVPAECIDAILIHEIGHSYRKHLLILPFILFGMFALPSLFSLLFFDAFHQALTLMDITYPSKLWTFLFPFTIFVPYVVIMALYFRLVFGFFSRMFERQADLHSYVVGSPSEGMINALDQIGITTGNTHNNPSWHHYSISERIGFLKKALEHPEIIEKHHKSVKRWVTAYFITFVAVCSILFSSSLTQVYPFNQINESVEKISSSITLFVTQTIMQQLVE